MKRFRFSLLSLLVGVVLAGGVVWLNLRPRLPATELSQPSFLLLNPGDAHSFGWPFTACREYFVVRTVHQDNIPELRECREKHMQWPGLAANIAIGLAIVFGGAGACEWLVRRRAKAKG